MVLGHELVGRRPDGRRVVANPLICCGRCMACLSGRQNLCSNWRLLGLGQTPGCFAEFVAVPDGEIYEIPDNLSDTRALTVEPLANIVHLFRIAAPLPFFRLGIVGCGAMGSLALLMAIRLGVREILVQDLKDMRVEMARKMGATLAVNVSSDDGRAAARQFAGDGLDLVLDASNDGVARQTALDLCRPGGLVVLLGMSQEPSEVDFAASIRKEQRIVMSFAYTPLDFERSLTLLKEGDIDLTQWTAEMPLDQGQQAFERMTSAPEETLKMVLRVS
jgi:threonine dehydrogenase-like Zn-dependent dehydrogenase